MSEEESEGVKPSRKKTGFAINAIYSPWLSLSDVAYKWLMPKGDQEKMQNFVNSWLGETVGGCRQHRRSTKGAG